MSTTSLGATQGRGRRERDATFRWSRLRNSYNIVTRRSSLHVVIVEIMQLQSLYTIHCTRIYFIAVFGGPGMSGNSHASHMYGSGSAYSSSPQLHQQYQQQQQQPHGVYTRVNSGASSGYGSGGQGLTSGL